MPTIKITTPPSLHLCHTFTNHLVGRASYWYAPDRYQALTASVSASVNRYLYIFIYIKYYPGNQLFTLNSNESHLLQAQHLEYSLFLLQIKELQLYPIHVSWGLYLHRDATCLSLRCRKWSLWEVENQKAWRSNRRIGLFIDQSLGFPDRPHQHQRNETLMLGM